MARGCMFHHLSGPGHPIVQGSVSLEDFQRILDTHKHLLRASDFLERHETAALEAHDEVLTFDDGLSSQWLAEPILRERGLTAFWFVPTAPLVGVASRLEIWRWLRTVCFLTVDEFYDAFAATAGWPAGVPHGYLSEHAYLSPRDRDFRYMRDKVLSDLEYERAMERVETTQWAKSAHVPSRSESLTDRWLTVDHLKALTVMGHVVGSHSHSHPTTLATLTHEAQEIEYSTSTWILEQILGVRPTVMSHPCNQYSDHGLKYLRQLGYTLGFRATPLVAEWGPLEVPRVDSADLVKEL